MNKKRALTIGAIVLGAIVVAMVGFFVFKSKHVNKGKIIAKAGNDVLTTEDLKRLIPPSLIGSVDPQVVIELWVRRSLMYQEAKKRGIDKKDIVKQRIEEAKKDIVVQALMEEEVSKVFVTNKEVEDYFNKHKDEFLYEVKLSQIVLPDEITANEVYNQLKKGADFKKLAEQKSIDPMKGEESKYLPRGITDPGLEEIIFSLQPGEFTKPIQTPDGAWRIIKVVDKKKVKEKAELNEWKDYIRTVLLTRKRQQRIMQLIDSLKNVYKVEIKPENILP